MESQSPSQPYQNFDYVYASVQKRSSEQNKLNEGLVYHDSVAPNRMNINDPSSLSEDSGTYIICRKIGFRYKCSWFICEGLFVS